MKSLKDKALAMWKDESAQGATEYILLLVVVVSIALIFRKNIQEIITSKMADINSGVQDFKTQ